VGMFAIWLLVAENDKGAPAVPPPSTLLRQQHRHHPWRRLRISRIL
jgi:hypothetical protein